MIKYMILSLAVFSAALLLTGCGAEADGAYKKISASEAKEMMDKGNVTIVDVREPSEYAGGHVPGAMLLPLGTVSSSAEKALPGQGRCPSRVLPLRRQKPQGIQGARFHGLQARQ